MVSRLVYELEFRYYYARKDYAKADVAMNLFIAALKRINMNFDEAGYVLMQARISKGLGRYQVASQLYDDYIIKNDSISRMADQLKTNEYAVQLDLNKANIERSEFSAKANRYRAQVMLLIALIAILVGVGAVLFVIYLRRVNRQLTIVNERLKNSFDRVDTLGRMKSALIMSMSREIRGPLNGITGFSQVISSVGGDFKQYTDIINDNSSQITKILDAVVDSSELETSEIEMEPVNVNECCQNAISANQEVMQEKVRFEYDPSDTELMINSSNRWFILIVSNLIDNACKFTQEGRITLKYTSDQDELHLSVTDTGCGVPADKAEWVFESFTKIDKFTRGTGLGLSICRMIVIKLGGSISIDTNYQNGCKVDLYLPCKMRMEEI